MKKTKNAPSQERILGRSLARELSPEDLEAATGGLRKIFTWSTTWPSMSPDEIVD